MREQSTKIVATIGPASMNKEVLRTMKRAGMNCARINTAHGDLEQYQRIIKMIDSLADVPVMLDIKGPELRVRTSKPITVHPRQEQEFFFSKNQEPRLSTDVYDDLSEGDVVYIDNGMIRARITTKNTKQRSVTLQFDEQAIIEPNKGVNIPYKELSTPSLSIKDKEVIKLGASIGVSYIALSFVRSAKDVKGVRRLLGKTKTKIIAKIENDQGVRNIDEIIAASDGIMIARGDLGIEIGMEKVPLIQKMIITACNQAGKPVIVATHMLESMTIHRAPTRAEVSDVANAVLDGADAVMLSGETAIGKYPVKAIETMSSISRELENNYEHKHELLISQDLSSQMSKAAYELSRTTNAAAIACITRGGFSANIVSRFRPRTPVLAVSDDKDVCKQLQLVWGVTPVHIKNIPDIGVVQGVGVHLAETKIVSQKDTVIFFAGTKTSEHNISNTLEVHNIKELLEHAKK